MQQPQASPRGQPFKTESGKPDRKFNVLDNGDVVMVENQTLTLTFAYPEFRSFMVNHEREIEKIDENLSEETKKKMLKIKEEMKGYVKEIKPFVEESEKKTKENYEKMMMDNSVKTIKDYFKKPKNERKPEYIAAILENLKKEEKIKELLSRLTPEESKIVVQVKLDLFRNKRKKR